MKFHHKRGAVGVEYGGGILVLATKSVDPKTMPMTLGIIADYESDRWETAILAGFAVGRRSFTVLVQWENN